MISVEIIGLILLESIPKYQFSTPTKTIMNTKSELGSIVLHTPSHTASYS